MRKKEKRGKKERRNEVMELKRLVCVYVWKAHRMEEKKVRRSERWRLAGTHRTHTRQLEWVSDLTVRGERGVGS